MSDIPDPESAQGDDVDVDDAQADGPDDVYNPSDVQVTRGREQGLGMGARDLLMQRDAHGGDSETESERLMRATAPKSGLTGLPDSDAQTSPSAQPSYPVADGDDVSDDSDSREDSNGRA